MQDTPKNYCECPVSQFIEMVSKKWILLILRTMCDQDKMRFSDIKKALPDINSRILSERLSELEAEEFLTRIVEDTKPIVISYQLTQKALDLKKVFCAFADWTKKWGKEEQKS